MDVQIIQTTVALLLKIVGDGSKKKYVMLK